MGPSIWKPTKEHVANVLSVAALCISGGSYWNSCSSRAEAREVGSARLSFSRIDYQATDPTGTELRFRATNVGAREAAETKILYWYCRDDLSECHGAEGTLPWLPPGASVEMSALLRLPPPVSLVLWGDCEDKVVGRRVRVDYAVRWLGDRIAFLGTEDRVRLLQQSLRLVQEAQNSRTPSAKLVLEQLELTPP